MWSDMEEEENEGKMTKKFFYMQPSMLIMNDLIMITALIWMRALSLRADGEAAAAHSGFPVLAVCSGILSVLLVASIGAIIYSEFHVDTLGNEQLHQLKSH